MEANSRVNYPVKTALVQLKNDGLIDMGIETTKGCVNIYMYTVGAWNYCLIPGKRQ